MHRRVESQQSPKRVDQQLAAGVQMQLLAGLLGESQEGLEPYRRYRADRERVEVDAAVNLGQAGRRLQLRIGQSPAELLPFPQHLPSHRRITVLGFDDLPIARRLADQQRRQHLLDHQPTHGDKPQNDDGGVVPTTAHEELGMKS